MKLNRSQKASLLKEIGNLISYFQTFEHMDVDKLINLMKEKYSSWKDANVEALHDDVNNVVTTIQKLMEEKIIETDNIETTNNYNIDVTVTGSNNSTEYLSSEATYFEDEQISTENEEYNDVSFSFTGFDTNNIEQTDAITISPHEFWYDEDKEEFYNN